MKKVVAAVLTVVAAYVGVEVGLLLRQLRHSVAVLEAEAVARGRSIENRLDERLRSVEQRLDRRLASTERRLADAVDRVVAVTDNRLGEVTAAADRLATAGSVAVGNVGQAASSVATLASTLDRTVTQWNAAVYPWFDCGTGEMGGGRPCLQYEAWWLAKKANATASSVAVAADTISSTINTYGPSTARSIDGIAGSLDRMGRWYTSRRRLFIESGLLLGGLWWRNWRSDSK